MSDLRIRVEEISDLAKKGKTPTKTPPKNGEITLLLTTNSLMCSKYVSQKRNEAIDNGQRYNMLLNFISYFAKTL